MDAMSESYEQERMRILRMVEEGELSAVDAAALLSSLSQKNKDASSAKTSQANEFQPQEDSAYAGSKDSAFEQKPGENLSSNSSPRWFRVRVTSLASGRAKATINLPIGLVNWGLKVGARYAPEVSGLDFDELGQIIQSGAGGKIVDVIDEEDGEHVEIFVE